MCSAWSLALLFLVPNNHASAWWLTREERLVAVARLRHNQTGIANRKFKMDQFIECMLDPKTWCFFLIGFVS